MVKSNDPVVDAMLKQIASRLNSLTEQPKRKGVKRREPVSRLNALQIASDAIWGVMFMTGVGQTVYIPSMRRRVAYEVRRRCDCTWAEATELISESLKLLHENNYIVIEGERAKTVPNPPFLPNMLTKIDRRWMEPAIHDVGSKRDIDNRLDFAGIKSATIHVTFNTRFSFPYTVRGVLDNTSFDRPLNFAVESESAVRLSEFSDVLYGKLTNIRKALALVSLGRFIIPDLGSIKVTGDPMAAIVLAVIAWGKPFIESQPRYLRFEADEVDFQAIERAID